MIDKKKYEERLSAFSFQENKPLEVYMFIDPLCTDCWALEPIIKKLQVEYGHYFSITYVLSGKLTSLNPPSYRFKKNTTPHSHSQKTVKRKCIDCNDVQSEVNLASPFIASVAIKAAELQGRKSGIRYMRKLQEHLFFKNQDITQMETLLVCARDANLDVKEFQRDILSDSTTHAFQCDLKITNEMSVNETPTIVIFNNKTDEEGLKIVGVHNYDVYQSIIAEVLGEEPVKHTIPTLLSFLKHYQFVTSEEIAVVYDWPQMKVEMEMKKLMLLQMVDKLESAFGTIWRFKNFDKME